MIGTQAHQARGFDDGVGHFTLDPMTGGPGSRGSIPPMAQFLTLPVTWPWKVDAQSGMLASPEWPRGIQRSANKLSELNILNAVPRVVLLLRTPYVQAGPMTQRILSVPMPVSASSIVINSG